MHAYLLIGINNEELGVRAIQISDEKNARLVPFSVQKMVDIKELKTFTKLVLSPTAFFIQDVHTSTIDTLNSFLKQLEEPSKNVTYILTASSEDKVLPTIVSRCEIIRLKNPLSLSDTEGQKNNTDTDQFFTCSVGQQLSRTDKIKKREDAISFIHQLIQEAHKILLRNPSSVISFQLEELGKTLTALEKNGNVTSQLTRLVVKINSKS